MTIDAETRTAAAKRVLILLAGLSRDSRGFRFGEHDLAPADPVATTLAELKAQGLIELAVHNPPSPWRLTLVGWLRAQGLAGYFGSEAFRDRQGALCAAMKAMVKGRDRDAFTTVGEVARAAGLPAEWVWNILDGNVLQAVDPKRRYGVRLERGNIRIPLTFGQEPVDLG